MCVDVGSHEPQTPSLMAETLSGHVRASDMDGESKKKTRRDAREREEEREKDDKRDTQTRPGNHTSVASHDACNHM